MIDDEFISQDELDEARGQGSFAPPERAIPLSEWIKTPEAEERLKTWDRIKDLPDDYGSEEDTESDVD